MRIIKDTNQTREWVKHQKAEGKKVGFVPTMGYLHGGHLSLIRKAREECDRVIISIFVNPTQFAPGEDLEKYPRDIEKDETLAKDAGVDVIFYPCVSDIYPEGFSTYVSTENLDRILEGASRPGHFKGVCTIVTKLFNIVPADIAYFGQKDAQQAAVIRMMVKDLNIDTTIKVLPTSREPDGLAMSSRNTFLNPDERADALVLYKALQVARDMVKDGMRETSRIVAAMVEMISSRESTKIDYVKIVDPRTFEELSAIKDEALAVLAVWAGETRLIDNMRIGISDIGIHDGK